MGYALITLFDWSLAFRKSIMKRACLVFLLTSSLPCIAQERNELLTTTISFGELEKTRITREVEWTNPDGRNERMTILEMAIPIDQKIKKLTLDFVVSNYHIDSIWLQPRMVVFHSMDLGNLQNSLERSSFLNDHIPESWGTLHRAGKLPNGAHFIIEKNGDIVCLTPPVSLDGSEISYKKENHKWLIRRHQDGNPVALGVENVTDRNGDFTDLTIEQIESNAKLARWLLWMENGKIKYLTSHHQFNDEKEFNRMLEVFSLTHYQKRYRTLERKDIGGKNLLKIIQKVEAVNYRIKSRFSIKD